MRVLGYIGVSGLSRLIQWRTWSAWSHVAIELDTGEVIDAWKEGVRLVAHPYVGHDDQTRVVAFEFSESPFRGHRAGMIERYLNSHIGARYDFRGVLRFISRRDPERDNGKFFCSELVALAFTAANYPLQRELPHRLSPGDICMSPRLCQVAEYGTAAEFFANHPEALVREALFEMSGERAAGMYRSACGGSEDVFSRRHGGTEEEGLSLRASVALCEKKIDRNAGIETKEDRA